MGGSSIGGAVSPGGGTAPGDDGTTLVSEDGAWQSFAGEASQALTAGGTITLASGRYRSHALRLTGTPAADCTVVFPDLPGHTWTVTNEQDSSSHEQMVFAKVTGGERLIYFGPGQTRRVTVVGGELADDADGQAILIQLEVSLIRGSAGSTDVVLGTLPRGTSLRGVSAYGTEDPDANVTFKVGTSADGDQILLSTDVPSEDSMVGDDPDGWGTDLADVGRCTYGADTTVTLRFTTDGTTTTGAMIVTVEAVRLTR